MDKCVFVYDYSPSAEEVTLSFYHAAAHDPSDDQVRHLLPHGDTLLEGRGKQAVDKQRSVQLRNK